jgi:phosphoserine phosphatase
LENVGVRPDAVFGNSIHDAAMLEMAEAPYVVNPTPALLMKASAERWPVYWPQAVRS